MMQLIQVSFADSRLDVPPVQRSHILSSSTFEDDYSFSGSADDVTFA